MNAILADRLHQLAGTYTDAIDLVEIFTLRGEDETHAQHIRYLELSRRLSYPRAYPTTRFLADCIAQLISHLAERHGENPEAMIGLLRKQAAADIDRIETRLRTMGVLDAAVPLPDPNAG